MSRDGQQPSTISLANRRPSKFKNDEEQVCVKPSTELIPDEYEHCIDEHTPVHIFCSQPVNDGDEADALLQAITEETRSKVTNHDLESYEEFEQHLKDIRSGAMGDYSALVLIFIGICKNEQDPSTLLLVNEKGNEQFYEFKQIWSQFSGTQCPALAGKPKVFLFCMSPPKKRLGIDGKRHYTHDGIYDFPSETDMLIVFKRFTGSRPQNAFLDIFSRNIRANSRKFDIIDLLTTNQQFTPIIISTLTRRFFLTTSDHREHYLSIHENHDGIEKSILKIRDGIDKLHEQKSKKIKDKLNFWSSFKRKNEDKPKVAVREKEKEAKDKKIRDQKLAVPTHTTHTTEASSSSVHTDSRRTRTTSVSESVASGRVTPRSSNSNKPPWR